MCLLFFVIECSYVQYSIDGVIKVSQPTRNGVERQIAITVYVLTVKRFVFCCLGQTCVLTSSLSCFPSLGSIIKEDNSISEEITHRIMKGNRAYYAYKD